MSGVIPDSFKTYSSDLSAPSTFSAAVTSQTLVKGNSLIVKLFYPPTFLSYSQNKLNSCFKDLYKPLDKADKSCKSKHLWTFLGKKILFLDSYSVIFIKWFEGTNIDLSLNEILHYIITGFFFPFAKNGLMVGQCHCKTVKVLGFHFFFAGWHFDDGILHSEFYHISSWD